MKLNLKEVILVNLAAVVIIGVSFTIIANRTESAPTVSRYAIEQRIRVLLDERDTATREHEVIGRERAALVMALPRYAVYLASKGKAEPINVDDPDCLRDDDCRALVLCEFLVWLQTEEMGPNDYRTAASCFAARRMGERLEASMRETKVSSK